MASSDSHDAKLADLRLQVDGIKSALDGQAMKLERILSVLLVLESKTDHGCEIKYLPIPQTPYITEIETFSSR